MSDYEGNTPIPGLSDAQSVAVVVTQPLTYSPTDGDFSAPTSFVLQSRGPRPWAFLCDCHSPWEKQNAMIQPGKLEQVAT
jgi:hypothetical protein